MWLFTVPVLKGFIKGAVVVSSLFLAIQVIRWYRQGKSLNPFSQDDRKKRRPYVTDQRQRDKVLKQSFSADKVPEDLDAVVIGSGIGGLTTAAIMAKSGKRVLVLEQHDQAGGCCHTFIDKGYEFDVGIHYIGKMGHPNLNKTLVDQVCEGQLEWAPLDDQYDVVSIGYGDDNKQYPVMAGVDAWQPMLEKQFPGEEAAIEKFFKLLDEYSGSTNTTVMLKIVPLWLARIVAKTPLLRLFTNLWHGKNNRSTLEVVQSLTDNKDLQTVFCYCWGDYGTPPTSSHFSMQALLNNHYMKGAFYPVGGASEIAFNIIPVVERNGGAVLVKADVQQILYNGKKVMGVLVKKGEETLKIEAPIVISSAGLYNTFEKLLPPQVAQQSYYHKICKQLKPGVAAMNIFVGFNKSNEDLDLRAHNIWAFTANDAGTAFDKYLELDIEGAQDTKVPLMFVSFPSAKDPNWKLHPGRENKSTCAIVTLANWEWYKKWEEAPLKRRGDDYEGVKNTIGHMLIDQMCELFPQVRDHIDYIDIGSPVTNKHYIAQPYGEIYGLDHTKERMAPWMSAKLRPQTDIPGLYLTGQDILSCGFTGALYGGLLTASVALERNLLTDLVSLHKVIKKSDVLKKNQ